MLVVTVVALAAAACGTSSVELAEAPSPAGPTTTTTASPGAPGTTSVPSTTSPEITIATVPSTTASTTTGAPVTTTVASTTSPEIGPPAALELDAEGVPLNGQTHGVVVTAGGWVLPVLGATEAGWRVWTPCGREADLESGVYLEHVDVVLDPGHGGPTEPGATSPGGLTEADLNLAVAERAAARLRADGRSVLVTRPGDVRLPIVTRGEIALALEPVAFISIHHNAGIDAPSPDPGTEMYFQLADPESRRLAGLLYEEAVDALAGYGVAWVSMSDAGAMARPNREGGDYYGVLRRPEGVTSVLAEFAYISNPVEARLLAEPEVQEALAASIVAAFDRFVGSADPGSGFTDEPIFRGYGPSGAGRTEGCVDPALG
ncbi:MAG: N-acetylmuramoyl-L-alanine amidase [Acidimicrobiales bacterium]